MAVWKCQECGNLVELRCKPGKCSSCGAEKGKLVKEEAEKKPKVKKKQSVLFKGVGPINV